MHKECTKNAQRMHKECTKNAQRMHKYGFQRIPTYSKAVLETWAERTLSSKVFAKIRLQITRVSARRDDKTWFWKTLDLADLQEMWKTSHGVKHLELFRSNS